MPPFDQTTDGRTSPRGGVDGAPRVYGTGNRYFGIRDSDGELYVVDEFPGGKNVCSVLDCGSVQGTDTCGDCGRDVCFLHSCDHGCGPLPLCSPKSPPCETSSGGDDLGLTLLEPGSPSSVLSLGSDSSGQSLGSVNSLGPFPPSDPRDYITVDPNYPSFRERGLSGSQSTPLDPTGAVGLVLLNPSDDDTDPSVASEADHCPGGSSLGPYPSLSLSGQPLLLLVGSLSSGRDSLGSYACSGPPFVGCLDLP